MLDLRQAQPAVAAATRKNYETGYIQLTADQVLESACKRVWVYIIYDIPIHRVYLLCTREEETHDSVQSITSYVHK